MKQYSFWFLTLSLNLAAASEPAVKITAFHYAGANIRAAELCGQVEGARPPLSGVKVVVDGNSSDPTSYYSLVGNDGKFCVTIVTYNGVADAYVWIPGEAETSHPTRAQVAYGAPLR